MQPSPQRAQKIHHEGRKNTKESKKERSGFLSPDNEKLFFVSFAVQSFALALHGILCIHGDGERCCWVTPPPTPCFRRGFFLRLLHGADCSRQRRYFGWYTAWARASFLIAAPIVAYCVETAAAQIGPGDLSTTLRVTRKVLPSRA